MHDISERMANRIQLTCARASWADLGLTWRLSRDSSPALASSVSRDTAPGGTKTSALVSLDRHIEIASPNGLLKISVLYRIEPMSQLEIRSDRSFGVSQRTQLSSLPQPPSEFPCLTEVRKSGFAFRSHQSTHFALVCTKLSSQLLKPRMADAELSRPGSTRRPTSVSASEPLKHESPGHQ